MDIGNGKRFLYLLFSIAVGILLAGILGVLVWLSRKKEDKNITYKQCFFKLIYPSIFASIAICFLVILKLQYVSPVQLLIISAIILTAFFSAIETKSFLVFIILIAFAFSIIGGDELIKKIKAWYNNRLQQIKSSQNIKSS